MVIFENNQYGKIELTCENKIIITPFNVQPNDTDGIRLVVVKVSNCENNNILELQGGEEKLYETLIYDDVILENTTKYVQLSSDGIYFLRIRDYYSENEETVLFFTYNNFIKSILDRTQKIFCGCNSCNTFNLVFKKSYEKEISLLLDYIILFSLLEECISFNCLNCQFEELLNCDYINENFKGVTQLNENKFNLILANLFNKLSLILIELNSTCNNQQISIIKKCIKKNNILIVDCIEPPISNCTEFIWDLRKINPQTVVSMKYTACNDTLESSITGTVSELGRTLSVCTNGITPTTNYGTIRNNGNCNSL